MRRDSSQRLSFAWLAAFTGAGLVALSCGQGDELLAPLTGALEVRVLTQGSAPDADGYTVAIDSEEGVSVATSDTVVRASLEPGSHSVGLTGIASNCSVNGGNPLPIRITADETASVEFRLSCSSAPILGTVVATVSTGGSPLDPNGYAIAIDPAPPVGVDVNGTVIVPDLPAGEHQARLQGMADHCSVAGGNPRSVTVPAADTARISFEVTCRPPLSGRIAFAGFRPDGSLNTDLFIIGADGTGLVNLTATIPQIDVSEPSFSRDGRHLVASLLGSPDEIVIIGTEIDPITGAAPIQRIGRGDCPELSSDGSRLAFQVIGDGIYLQDLAGSVPDLILAEPATASFGCPAWSPDDSRLAVPVNLFSPDRAGVYIVPVAGGEPALVTLGPDDDFIAETISWSPVGDRLAFSMPCPDNVECRDVFVMDLDGNATNLTQHRVFFADGPSWSPDGTRLVFEGNEGLFLINSDGTGLARLTRDDNRVDRQPTWASE
jgi:hypothetical protein